MSLDSCSCQPLLSNFVQSSVAMPGPRGGRGKLLGGPGFQQPEFTLVQVSPQDKVAIGVAGTWRSYGPLDGGTQGNQVVRYLGASSVLKYFEFKKI